MSKKTLFIIIGVVVIVGGLVYINLQTSFTKTTSVNAKAVAVRDLTEDVSASGRIQPKTKVDITAEINAEIIALPVKDGQPVKTGDLLVVLDTVQYASDVHQAKYRLEEVEARLAGAQTIMEQNEESFDRRQLLYDKGLSSDSAYNNARWAHLNSSSNYDALLAQARQLQAAYEKQLDYLSKAKIHAPMDGVITYLDAEVGEIASAQTAFTQGRTIMTISDLSIFEVEVEVDETEINKISLGQMTSIEVDAIPDSSFAGSVVEIGNTAIMAGAGTQDLTTNFRVKVTFHDAGLALRPGMSATVDITTAERNDVFAVPFASIIMRTYDLDSLEAARQAKEAGSTLVNEVQAAGNDEVMFDDTDDEEQVEHKGVFVVRDGVARFVIVETGIADRKNVEVSSGLTAEDTVISGPYRVLRSIKDGDAVEVEKKDKNKGAQE